MRRFSLSPRFCLRGGHGVHAPFAYHLITRVVQERAIYRDFSEIQALLRGSSRATYKRALLAYRIASHYPLSSIHPLAVAPSAFDQALLPLLQGACCSQVEGHPYGPFLPQDHFVFAFSTTNEAQGELTDTIRSIIEKRQPLILLLPPLVASSFRSLFASLSYGIRLKTPIGEVWILAPRLTKQTYRCCL